MTPVPSPARREIASLTALRGGLAGWVVVYHFWNDVVALFPGADALSPVARNGYLAVPAFFMLSGYVLAHTYTAEFRTLRRAGVIRFLARRLARVYPVHLVTLLAVGAMVGGARAAGMGLTDAGYTARDFVRNLLLAQTWVPDFALNWNYPAWSISSEWFAYLWFPAAVAGATRLGLDRPGPAVGLAVAGAAAEAGVLLYWRPWPFYELVLVVPAFAAGAAACWAVRAVGRPPAAVGRAVPFVLAAALGGACFGPSAAVVVGGAVASSLALIAVLGAAGGACHPVWTARLPVFVGEVSYSLYMTHTLAQKLVHKLLPASGFVGADPPTRAAVLVAYAVLVAALCLATYWLVEKPCRERFRRPRAGGRAAPAAEPAREGVPCAS